MLNAHYSSISRAAPALLDSDVDFIVSQPLLSELGTMFEFLQVDKSDVYRALIGITKDCAGRDQTIILMLKLAYPALGSHLTELFNRSLKTGSFPQVWKMATIFPLS